MRNIVGQFVSGADFFERPVIIGQIRRAIRNGNNVYLSAPRRVGKTSIMHYLADNPEPDQHYVYVITQSIDSVDNFYKELAEQVMDSPAFRKMDRVSDGLKKVASSLLQRISLKVNIPFIDITLDKDASASFQTDFEKLLEEINLAESRLIIMVDEFTETVDNILIKHGPSEARRLLQTFRALMHNRKVAEHVQFLLTGSIGLQPLVQKLDASDLVNHLRYVDIPALTEDEACTLFRKLTTPAGVQIDDETIQYILRQIDWLMPFHVQLLVQEVIDVMESDDVQVIDQAKAERAFQQLFHQRNKIYFVQYYERLKKRIAPGPEAQFVHDVLNHAAANDELDMADIHDLAVKHNFADGYRATLESLEYDGYLHRGADAATYRFSSSILKTWWKKYVS